MKPLAACVEQVTGARHPIYTLDCVLPHIYCENVHAQYLSIWVGDSLRDVGLAHPDSDARAVSILDPVG
jgi:hypothetical protein